MGRDASKVGGRHGREEEMRERSVREEVIWEEGRLERGVADGRLEQEGVVLAASQVEKPLESWDKAVKFGLF